MGKILKENIVIALNKPCLVNIKDRKLLMVRSANKEIFYFPGGKNELGENDFECLKRELKEELKVDLVISSLEKYMELTAQAHGKPIGTFIKYNFYIGDFVGDPIPSSEIEEYKYFSSKDGKLTDSSGVELLMSLKNDGLID